MVVPNELDPANSSTVLLASAVPVKVGVVSLVRLSSFDVPVSESGARSGVDGLSGGSSSRSELIYSQFFAGLNVFDAM